MKLTVVDAQFAHLLPVLPDIRHEDLHEWYAASGGPFLPAAKRTIDTGAYKRVALGEDGKALCFWGCDRGYVWLFATKAAVPLALSLHRILKPELQKMLDIWPILQAISCASNEVHHDWLKWLGFECMGSMWSGPRGFPFKLFVKDTTQCA